MKGSPTNNTPPLVTARGVSKRFPIRAGLFSRKIALSALDAVDLELHEGEILGVVGESGCGKTTLGKAVLGLVQADAGELHIAGIDVRSTDRESVKNLRKSAQMIFQHPAASFNPAKTIGASLREVHRHFFPESPASQAISELMSLVALPEALLSRKPSQVSGGQMQRFAILRALIPQPRLIVADEAVSALDVSIQAQILELLQKLRETRKISIMFISHDLRVIAALSDRILVMYLGRVVELGDARTVFDSPFHPYTKALFASAPRIGSRGSDIALMTGDPPGAISLPTGCAFRTRCTRSSAVCETTIPSLRGTQAHSVACHNVQLPV